MSAVGIHAHPNRKLGRRPPKRAARLELGRYLTGVCPPHPSHEDHIDRPGLAFGLYENDRFGDCGPTSVANLRRLVTAWLTGAMHSPSQDAVFDLYRRSGNPNFDPQTDADDNGVDMQTMLEALVAGGIDGVNALGFAAVDTANHNQLRAAVALFGGLLYGVNLETVQQSQTDGRVWDYHPSPPWGGHAILGAGYTTRPDHEDVITWAERVSMTSAFMRHQLDEAWVVIFPEHLGSVQFTKGIDLAALASDYQALTGRPWPGRGA